MILGLMLTTGERVDNPRFFDKQFIEEASLLTIYGARKAPLFSNVENDILFTLHSSLSSN